MFCTFPLKQIFRGSLRYDVGISDMSVNGKTVPSIRYTDRIKLDYEQRSFKVQAYTNNYASPFTCGIMYKLEPFDHEWLHANNLNEISYTNLSSGNYTLYIRGDAAQADGTYPEHRLAIVIHPPFYRTTLAFLLYGLLLLLLSYGIYYVTVLRASLRMEQAQQRNREELNQSKFRFFTNISHEFKTPLTLLSNQVELLLQNHTLSASVNTKLLSVWRNIVRLNRLIVELIEFRRQEQGITPLKVNRNNLVELMVGVTDAFREYAQTRKISLNRFAEQPEICFMFDRQLMERALFNLLSNAFKFTPENGTISVHLKQLGKQALIEVSDTGIGIDADELEHIFEHFYQTSNVSFTNSVGTGIGLAYTKNIVEAHQGIITVKSIKSKGSTFTILLPVNVVYEQNQIANSLSIIKDNEVVSGIAIPPIAPAERSVRACKEETMRYRLLIVEDDAELRELLAETFASQYSVEVAANGRIGYDKAIGELPDIVISDVMMPEMSGTELCRKLKNNLRTSHIPVILLTSQSAPEYVCEGLTVGADDYIGKPFSIKHLFIRCNNLVNLRHTLQQKYAHEIASDSTQLALSPLDQQLLDTAVRLIEENLDNPQFSVDFLSRETGMGRTRYYAKMKAITGMTPNEFVLNHKLKMACRLIDAHPERSITELAESLGFSNTSYFIQRFKEFTGDTPHNYRQKMIS
jgi:signal transduction histidine kinase/DNA-binding response OmpR family regulator